MKTPKSTYYDKWGPSDSWTMAASKIRELFNQEAEGNWGAAKRYARNNCNYTWSGLQETVRALHSIDLITIRRFARKTWRYMDLYRHGVTGKLAEYAAKKYISHRRIPKNDYSQEIQHIYQHF